MTEFEIKHGLSQDAPGPLEPVELAASPVSTVEQGDAQGELTRDRIEEIAREVYKVERFTKGDEVWHNLFWLTSFAKAIEKELRPAPAAGDAPSTVSLVTRQGPGQQLFTYTAQPCDNVIAWQIGEACSNASRASAGDYIDRGLGLLKELQANGYGIAAIAAQPAQQGAGE